MSVLSYFALGRSVLDGALGGESENGSGAGGGFGSGRVLPQQWFSSFSQAACPVLSAGYLFLRLPPPSFRVANAGASRHGMALAGMGIEKGAVDSAVDDWSGVGGSAVGVWAAQRVAFGGVARLCIVYFSDGRSCFDCGCAFPWSGGGVGSGGDGAEDHFG